jgi:RNA polymerase sigma factor (TIGR02999 family)
MATPQNEVTSLLLEVQKGNSEALSSLIPLVYSELRRLASFQLGHKHPEQTLNTTDLVHEAFLKLVGPAGVQWESRAHFFGAAANAMRQIIVAEARKRFAQKRGGSLTKVSLDEGAILTDANADQFVALDEALKELATCDERLARIVELRFFAGLTIDETAKVLDISPATVKRDWIAARAFLHRMMSSES